MAPAEVNGHGLLDEVEDPEPPKKKRKIAWEKEHTAANPSIPHFRYDGDQPVDEVTEMIDCFRKLVDDDVVELLLRYTKAYAIQKGIVLDVTRNEMYVFLAIHFYSGFHQLPYKELYWNTAAEFDTRLIREAMSRDKFRLINKCLHLSNNEHLTPDDRFAKVLPISNILRENFRKHAHIEQNVSVDEAIIKYFGRHGCKQYIKGKPIRFGFKVWAANNTDGYLLDFEYYQGAKTNIPKTEFGLGASVVINFANRLPGEGHHIFCDRFFTGLPMIEQLGDKGIAVTGTIQKNRLQNCPLKENSLQQRGDYDFSKRNDILIVKWQDNAEVYMASNCSSVFPLATASRYSQTEKKRIELPQPQIIKQYNKNMGGTDLMDNHINTYRISIRGKKWWHCIFTWLFDVAMSNAWLIYRRKSPATSQLAFRRQVVRDMLSMYGENKRLRSTETGHLKVSQAKRFDGMNHWIVTVPKQLRCALTQCQRRPKTKCEKCGVGLCAMCFKAYHIM